MAKLNREAMATYLDTAFNTKVADASKAVFEIIGDDIEEMSVELNPDTEQNKNILGAGTPEGRSLQDAHAGSVCGGHRSDKAHCLRP